jgi:hypothetical protein
MPAVDGAVDVAWTVAVGTLVADAVPALFDAVAVTRSVNPTSPAPSR